MSARGIVPAPSVAGVWVSAREAVRILAPALSGDAQAKAVLRAGLAGTALETGRGRLYDDRLVLALARRPVVEEGQLAVVCPHGLYVARLPRSARLDVSLPWEHLAAQVGSAMEGQRPLTPLSAALASVRTRLAGGLPFVATYLGYVVLAADLARLDDAGPALERPRVWSRVVERRRLPTRRGGRPAYVWTPPPD